MKKLLMLAACVLAFSGAAWAADEGAKAQDKTAPAAPLSADQKGWKEAVVGPAGAEVKKVRPPETPQDPPLKKSDADEGGLYPGYRGVALPISSNQVVFLKKGDRVDVLVTFDAKMADDRKEKVTATILQNVLVVNVQKPTKADDKEGIVELLLNPNEAQYAALSIMQGQIHISIRSRGDTEMHPMEMASFRKLFK
ncbi:MAG: RcpC/CpaB family pilus assembly protein [Elusimicrobiota bacterium]|jgi:hypothetical protein